MRRLAVALVSAGLLAGHADAGNKGAISVVATRGPITPVCAVEVPCSGPAPGVRLTVRHLGVVVMRAVTDRKGHARLAVSPGRYTVTASYGGGLGPRNESARVVVAVGRTSVVRFAFDTGIR